MNINKIINLSDGSKIVEFVLPYEFAIYNFMYDRWEWNNTFRLNKENLLIRIKNLKEQNIDTSVEEKALYLLEN